MRIAGCPAGTQQRRASAYLGITKDFKALRHGVENPKKDSARGPMLDCITSGSTTDMQAKMSSGSVKLAFNHNRSLASRIDGRVAETILRIAFIDPRVCRSTPPSPPPFPHRTTCTSEEMPGAPCRGEKDDHKGTFTRVDKTGL